MRRKIISTGSKNSRSLLTSDAVAMNTVVEYAVLTTVSLTVALALFWAAADFYNMASGEGERIALKNIAAQVQKSAGELSRYRLNGTVELLLPDSLGGLPYIIEPDPGGAGIRLHMLKENSGLWVMVPLLCPGVHMDGCLYSTHGPHQLDYNAATGRMTIC